MLFTYDNAVVNHECLLHYTRSDTPSHVCNHWCADNRHCSAVYGHLCYVQPQEGRCYNVGCYTSSINTICIQWRLSCSTVGFVSALSTSTIMQLGSIIYNFLWCMNSTTSCQYTQIVPTCYHRNKGDVENIIDWPINQLGLTCYKYP